MTLPPQKPTLLLFLLLCAGILSLSLIFAQGSTVAFTSLALPRKNLPVSSARRSPNLPYPPVAASEITIKRNGAATMRDFLTQLITQSSKVTLSQENYQTLLKDKQGVILFPDRLVAYALAKNNFTEIRPSLVILRDFIGRQEALTRSIPVATGNAASSKSIIGFQRLTVNLMNKALEREAGRVSAKEFQDYFVRYKSSADAFYKSIEQAASVSMNSPPLSKEFALGHFMESKLALFANIADAAISIFTPFGGKITKIDFSDCYCVGAVLTVHDYATYRTLDLVLTYISMFLLRGGGFPNAFPQHYILGLYLQGAGICLSGQYCATVAKKDGLIITPPTGTDK